MVTATTLVGFQDIYQRALRSVQQDRSVAIIGGRKCGGSILLKTLFQNLPAMLPREVSVIPRYLDLREVVPREPEDIFRALFGILTEGLPGLTWERDQELTGYARFLANLRFARPALDQRYGPRWALVVAVDSFEAATVYLEDDEVFHNMQSLMRNPEWGPHFRFIVAGGTRLQELITKETSVDALSPVYCRMFSEAEARDIWKAQPEGLLSETAMQQLLQLTGRQPFLLMSLLARLGEGGPVSPEAIFVEARGLTRDRRGVLELWINDIGDTGREVYRLLSSHPKQCMRFEQIQASVMHPDAVDDAIHTLAYHGLLDDADRDCPRVTGGMFRDWFGRVYGRSDSTSIRASVPSPEVRSGVYSSNETKRVFVVYGRNERVRVALFTFLRSLGLQPIEWHEAVEFTANPSPHVSDIVEAGFRLAAASVVLLTPDDDACLRAEFQNPGDPEFELRPTGQPRPNVLFEAGMSWALFPKKTVLVQVGQIRPFSDMSGIHVLQMDGSLDRRRQLATRLKMAGCAINDLDLSTEWHTAGNFVMSAAKAG